MTRLTIEIDAEDDRAALRVLGRLRMMMNGGRDRLNEAGYTAGALDGSGTVRVEHFDAHSKTKTP